MARRKKEGQIDLLFPTSNNEGRISQKMFEQFLFKEDGTDVVTCIGGPPTFTKAAMDILIGMGYS